MTEVAENRLEWLFEESKKFLNAVGLHEELMLEILNAETDWEFIIKIDAMLEAAAKEMVKERFNLGTEDDDKDTLNGFAEALPMSGRTSLLAVLKADGAPKDMIEAIDAVRRLRNGFAHDIRLIDSKLVEIIKARPDKSYLIKALCQIEEYDEAILIRDYEKDGRFLRFGIIHAALQVLIIAYNITNADAS